MATRSQDQRQSRFPKVLAQNIISQVNYYYRRNRTATYEADRYVPWSKTNTRIHRKLIRIAKENKKNPYFPNAWSLCQREVSQSLHGVFYGHQPNWQRASFQILERLNTLEPRDPKPEVTFWNIAAYLVTTRVNRAWSPNIRPLPDHWPNTWKFVKRTVNLRGSEAYSDWEVAFSYIKRVSLRKRQTGWGRCLELIQTKNDFIQRRS